MRTAVIAPSFHLGAATRHKAGASPADRILQALVLFGILAEIVVFIEPAPVDVILMCAFGLALVLGKLSFQNITIEPIAALSVFSISNLVSLFDPADLQRAVI